MTVGFVKYVLSLVLPTYVHERSLCKTSNVFDSYEKGGPCLRERDKANVQITGKQNKINFKIIEECPYVGRSFLQSRVVVEADVLDKPQNRKVNHKRKAG